MRTLGARVLVLLAVLFSFVSILFSTDSISTVPLAFRISSRIDSKHQTSPQSRVHVTFVIYESDVDTRQLWTSERDIYPAADGRFSTTLTADETDEAFRSVFATGEARWFSFRYEDGTESPRVMLVSVPYALHAASADTLGGFPASAYVRSSQEPQVTAENSRELKSLSATAATSGTPNAVAKFSTATDLTNSIISDTGENIGIGISNPTQRLDLLGRAKLRARSASAGLWLTDDAGNEQVFVGQTGTLSSDQFGVWHGGAWRFTVDSTGQVAVGRRTAEERLDVNGRLLLRPDGWKTAGFWLGGDDAGPQRFLGAMDTTASAPFAIWHGNAWRFRVDSDGNISAGGHRPVEKLDVAGRLFLRPDGLKTPGLWLAGEEGSAEAFVGLLGITSTSPFGVWHGGRWRIALDLNGNLGVGTATPSSKLDVAGDIGVTGALKFSDGTSLATAAGLRPITSADPALTISTTPTGSTIAIAEMSIAGEKIADAAISAAKLADGAVTAQKLAPNSVGQSSIADSAIATSKLADGAVTAQKLAANSVSQSSIADFAVSTSKLAAASVTADKVADGAITLSKIAPGVIPSGNVSVASTNDFTAPQHIAVSTTADYALRVKNSATSGVGYAVRGEVSGDGGVAISGYASSLTGTGSGVQGRSDAAQGIGVYGEAYKSSGANFGMLGLSRSSAGIGVQGQSVSSTGTNYGVYGITASESSSAGVYGVATKSTASTGHYGVYGSAAGTYGVGTYGMTAGAQGSGVFGYATSTSGAPNGVFGKVDAPGGVAGKFLNTATSGNVITASGPSGLVWRVDVLGQQYMLGTVHNGGADYAELIRSNEASQLVPGDAVVISESDDRSVEISSRPYETNALGIYSTKPGIVGSTHPLVDRTEEEIPVAMLGIVPAKVSAENGAIRRGDLLVTSSTPGHLMKGTDRALMQGAIVGKAMQPFNGTAGVIEIAVTLQ